MAKIDGETFLGRLLIFFFGGAGEGKRNSRARDDDETMFHRTIRVPNSPRLPCPDTFVVRLRQPVDLVHALKTVKGLLFLVPSRTPRSSGYDFYTHVVYVMCYMSITCTCLLYVVIYYMSVKCYVSVLCLVLAA